MKPVHLAILIAGVVGLAAIGGFGVLSLSDQHRTAGVNATMPVNAGFTQVPSDTVATRFSLDEAVAEVNRTFGEENPSRENIPVCYVQGLRVDGAGRAEQWILGICSKNTTLLATYDRNGAGQIPWKSERLPNETINLPDIISPAAAMQLAGSKGPAFAGDDVTLELAQGMYTVTARPGTHPAICTINASTGEVTSCNA